MISVKKFRYLVLAVAAYAVLAIVINLADPNPSKTRAANTSVSNVNVVNPAASPVPTIAQGTTNVAGMVGINNTPSVMVSGTPGVDVMNTPNVNASQSGPWTVGIDPLGNTVQILRPPWLPARQPFAAQFQCTISENQDRCQDTTSIAVSDTKALVIEFVSWQITLPTGGHSLAVKISTQPFSVVPTRFNFDFPRNTVPVDDGITATDAGAWQTTLHSAPTRLVYAICLRSGTYGTGNCTGSLSGYFEDVP